MFAPASSASPGSSLGFWVSEGIAPGLTLAGFTPPRPGEREPGEVHAEQGGHIGRLLRWVFPADIEDAP